MSKKRNATKPPASQYQVGGVANIVIWLDIKAGDNILFGKYSGTEVKVDGEELLVMKEEDIMAVIEK